MVLNLLASGLLANSLDAVAAYRINTQQSLVSILVYADGALARFGHNHVMTSGAVSGTVAVDSTTQQVDLQCSFPVAQLIVDDPQARRAAGSDFASSITESARADTRRDMLGRKVMDAENYPLITLQSVHTSGPLQSPQLTVRITIKGVSRELPVSASVLVEGASLTATGEFDILQTDFGITPLRIAFGALRIDDRLHVRFAIKADR